jgi:hypothetical protein
MSEAAIFWKAFLEGVSLALFLAFLLSIAHPSLVPPPTFTFNRFRSSSSSS